MDGFIIYDTGEVRIALRFQTHYQRGRGFDTGSGGGGVRGGGVRGGGSSL